MTRSRSSRISSATLFYGIALTAALSSLGLWGGGGLLLGRQTFVQIALDAVAAILAVVALLSLDGRRWWGLGALLAFALYGIVNAASIVWSVEPSVSWLETNRTFSWIAVFCTGMALVRTSGRWWRATLWAIVVSSVIICLWALTTKILPEQFAADEIYARLREPYEYWNSIGLTAALGIVAAVWAGARRDGHGLASAAAYPAVVVLTVAMMLAYSRGSLLALVLGMMFWFAFVPLRLRGAAVLIVGCGGGLLVTWWAFSQAALTTDRIDAAQRSTSGIELGVALLLMSLVAFAIGCLLLFGSARRPPNRFTRRRVGAVLLIGVCLVPFAVATKFALSERGLGGTVSMHWNALTDPRDSSRITNDPSRLTQVASVRAKYWQEATKVFRAYPETGVGAGGYEVARKRFRTGTLTVRHAHGFAVQTAADLGIIGLVSIVILLCAWLAAADRTIGWGRRIVAVAARRLPRAPEPGRIVVTSRWDAERVGLASMVVLVVTFGISSFVDWTWYVPGNAAVALLCAGWVAGRGSLLEPPSDPAGLRSRIRAGARSPLRAAAATFVVLLAATAIWASWQPLASDGHALDAQERAKPDPESSRAAIELADKSRSENPLSLDPIIAQAYVYVIAGRTLDARRALEDGVRLQPSNPESWLQLADFALHRLRDPKLALRLLGPALHLDPRSPQASTIYLEALRAAAADQAAAEKKKAGKRSKKTAKKP